MKEKKCYDIDFVIPWVDGSDPVWIEEFNKYLIKNNKLGFYFEAFDEPWKGGNNPIEAEKNWGLYYVNRTKK